MNKKSFVLIIILTLFLTVSVVSANENITDEQQALKVNDDVAYEQPVLKSNGTTVTETKTLNTTIKASDTVGYASFSNEFKVKLTADGKNLADKNVKLLLNGKTYSAKTNNDGEAVFKYSLSKRNYDAKFSFDAVDNFSASSGVAKITVKNPSKTTLKVVDKDINYRQGLKSVFMVKLVDENGKVIRDQAVTFKVAGKTYTAKTDSKGIATIYLSLKKGTHNVKFSFSKNAPYLSSSGSFKVKVKASMGKGNGYWVWASHMKKVNLKSLSKKGCKQIFLHCQAISLHGKKSVVSWIKKAHKYGMKVHIWMQVCYQGGKWSYPVTKGGTYKYSFINKKIKQAKAFAKIKGVDGVHFDYIRFGGSAHNYKNAVNVMNYVTKKASIAVHNVKSNSIVSIAVMPEPSSMQYYYGQDIPTMSKYVDAILPMVYKGNYHQKTPWIKSVTQTFKKQSNGAQIWTGLQSYRSDDKPYKLSQSELLKDARAAKNGGGSGVILFRYGISCNFNFNRV